MGYIRPVDESVEVKQSRSCVNAYLLFESN